MAERKIRLLVEVTVPEIHASRTNPRLAADALQRVLAGGYSAQVEAFHDLAPWWETAKVTVDAWTHTPDDGLPGLGGDGQLVLDGRLKLHQGKTFRLGPVDAGDGVELVWTRDEVRMGSDEGGDGR